MKLLLLGVCGFVLLGGGGVSWILQFCVFFCCCGTYFYIQALKGGRALLKNWVWLGVEMAIETKVFQFSEVQTHGSPTDCWLIIHGKVGSFIHHHHPPENNFLKFFLQTHVCMCLGLFDWFFFSIWFFFLGFITSCDFQ